MKYSSSVQYAKTDNTAGGTQDSLVNFVNTTEGWQLLWDVVLIIAVQGWDQISFFSQSACSD